MQLDFVRLGEVPEDFPLSATSYTESRTAEQGYGRRIELRGWLSEEGKAATTADRRRPLFRRPNRCAFKTPQGQVLFACSSCVTFPLFF